VLARPDFEGLVAVFKFFDKDSSGSVSFEEMVDSGLMDRETATSYLREWDKNTSGELCLNEFCEMLCPIGYRAHDKAERGTDAEGRLVVLDRKTGSWRRTEALTQHALQWIKGTEVS